MSNIPNYRITMEILDDVQSALEALPDVMIISSEDDVSFAGWQFDRLLIAKIKGHTVGLVIEAKSGGYPRDIQTAMPHLTKIRNESWPYPLMPLYTAPAISDTSRKLLRSDGIGFWDSGGSLYLELPWVLYWIDRPVPHVRMRKRRDIYHGRATQVLHAMLLEPERPWHVQDLATCAEVSRSTAHQVLVYLEEQLWVEKKGKGPEGVRVLREPGALIDAWAARHSLDEYKPTRFHRWARRPTDLEEPVVSALDELGIDYALTLASGAHGIAPFATDPGRLTLLAPESVNLDQFAHIAKLKPVEEGENVVLFQTTLDSPLMFRQRLKSSWIASDVQLYLDLWAWPQRGKEQARHLRQERLHY